MFNIFLNIKASDWISKYMEKLKVHSGHKLFGSIDICSSKNALLPILAGSVVCDGEVVLKKGTKIGFLPQVIAEDSDQKETKVKDYILSAGHSIDIGLKAIHSLQNPYDQDLEVVEIQKGDILSEDDIIRYEDIYGRV